MVSFGCAWGNRWGAEVMRMRRGVACYGVVMEFELRWLGIGLMQKDALVMKIGRFHAKNGGL